MILTEAEARELASLRAHFPFRCWFIVKDGDGPAQFYYSLRSAKACARKCERPELAEAVSA